MIRKTLLTASMTVGLAMTVSAPAHASWFGNLFGGCKRNCNVSSSSSGGSTSSGSTSSTGGSTQVPEPGMLGLMGAGVVALAIARRKKAKRD